MSFDRQKNKAQTDAMKQFALILLAAIGLLSAPIHGRALAQYDESATAQARLAEAQADYDKGVKTYNYGIEAYNDKAYDQSCELFRMAEKFLRNAAVELHNTAMDHYRVVDHRQLLEWSKDIEQESNEAAKQAQEVCAIVGQ